MAGARVVVVWRRARHRRPCGSRRGKMQERPRQVFPDPQLQLSPCDIRPENRTGEERAQKGASRLREVRVRDVRILQPHLTLVLLEPGPVRRRLSSHHLRGRIDVGRPSVRMCAITVQGGAEIRRATDSRQRRPCRIRHAGRRWSLVCRGWTAQRCVKSAQCSGCGETCAAPEDIRVRRPSTSSAHEP